MWQTVLTALLAELQAHPEQVLAILDRVLGLLEKNPAALTALIKLIPSK